MCQVWLHAHICVPERSTVHACVRGVLIPHSTCSSHADAILRMRRARPQHVSPFLCSNCAHAVFIPPHTLQVFIDDTHINFNLRPDSPLLETATSTAASSSSSNANSEGSTRQPPKVTFFTVRPSDYSVPYDVLEKHNVVGAGATICCRVCSSCARESICTRISWPQSGCKAFSRKCMSYGNVRQVARLHSMCPPC